MLRQHIESTGPEILGIQFTGSNGIKRGLRLQIFKPVAGSDQRPRRLVKPVIGPPDPL